MSHALLDISGTRPFAAAALRRLFLSWYALAVYVLLMGCAVFVSVMYESAFPFAVIGAVLLFCLHIIDRFLKENLENDRLPLRQGDGIAARLSSALVRQLGTKRNISSGDLLEAVLASKRGSFIVGEIGTSASEMQFSCRKQIEEQVDVKDFLEFAARQMADFGETRVDANMILYYFFQDIQSCSKLLEKADMSMDDVRGLLVWEAFHHRFRVRESAFDPDAIRRNSSMGRSWVTGYTNALDELTTEVDATVRISGEKSIVIHYDAIEAMLRTLGRDAKRNVLLVGAIGVGKKNVVANFAVALRESERARHLPFTRVLQLHVEKLLSGVTNPDAFLFHALARAQKSGHLILVIHDLPLLLKSGSANLRSVLMKCLEAQNISIIGIANTADYHTDIKTNALLDNQFEKIDVGDATETETMQVLMAHYFTLEHHGVRIAYKALKSIVDLSKRYLPPTPGFPAKAIEVMNDAVLLAAENRNAFVTEEHVRAVISRKGKINITAIGVDERTRLLHLEETMNAKIVGQDVAVKALTSSLKRARIDLRERKKPIGTFLFLGPTGVGKTHTAKVLAKEYFGSEDAIIRLDMNEFGHADSVFGIIGMQGMEGFLTKRVQDRPFSLILLDEIEKAHKSVLNLFLQILDEGFLNDSRGIRTDFRNTIIIATSNAGAVFIRDFIKTHAEFSKAQFKSDLIDAIIHEQAFAPEFLNRFDEIVLYYPLSVENASHLAMQMIGDIVKEIQEKRGITVKVEEAVVQDLVRRGYSIDFGAREMKRIITEMIEDKLADYMLRNDVKRGQEIVIRDGA